MTRPSTRRRDPATALGLVQRVRDPNPRHAGVVRRCEKTNVVRRRKSLTPACDVGHTQRRLGRLEYLARNADEKGRTRKRLIVLLPRLGDPVGRWTCEVLWITNVVHQPHHVLPARVLVGALLERRDRHSCELEADSFEVFRVREQDLDDLAAVEDVPAELGVSSQRAEAVARDETEPASLPQTLDPVCEEHRVGVGIAGSQASRAPIRVALTVEPRVDRPLVIRLTGLLRKKPWKRGFFY